MRLDGEKARNVLADAWERWAQRCADLTPAEWSAPTRCTGWDVAALVAHACPGPTMFAMLKDAAIDGPAAVTDAAEMLRRFNEPDGVAHTSADQLAETAVSEAQDLSPETAAARFRECAEIVRAPSMPDGTVVGYPVIGSTTFAVVTEVALMEATVHLLDLADAVGGVEPSEQALAATRDLLVAVPDPRATVEVLAGRAQPGTAIPAIR